MRVLINIALSLSFVDLSSQVLMDDEAASIRVDSDDRLEWHHFVDFFFKGRPSTNDDLEVLVGGGDLAIATMIRREALLQRRAI